MVHCRVLVLERQRFHCSVLIKMLHQLGIRDVLRAGNLRQAIAQVQRYGHVDIVLCDVTDRSLDILSFLRETSRKGGLSAVVFCSEVSGELRRSLELLCSQLGLQMLGFMTLPVQPCSLNEVLHRYVPKAALEPNISAAPLTLPSAEEIHLALEKGEFSAWFQPKFSLTTGTFVGMEALARWNHPSRGVLVPADFLSAVLAYDLVDQMFEQLLEQGIRLLVRLRTQSPHLVLALNLHASQLAADQLVEHVERLAAHYGLPGDALMFEVAENGLLDSSPQVQKNLKRLRLLGCGLSVDDFGKGFSSLKLLSKHVFTQLKLDGSLLSDLTQARTKALVASALALARTLDMDLVIEGVSNQDIRDTLTQWGCEFGQGYFLARPMPEHGLLRWIENYRRTLG